QKYNIICLSNQLWDFPNWTNKRHVMSRMAKLGHNVLFVDPPINLGRVFARQILRGHWGLKRIFTQQKKSSSGAQIYTPINLIPLTALTSKLHALRIRALSKKFFSTDRKTLLWVYHVEIAHIPTYVSTIPHDLLIYDCVDNYEGFPRNNTPEKKAKVRAKEKYLATSAKLVFATAPGLADKLKQYNENVYFTPNVGDYKKFFDVKNRIKSLPQDLEQIPRPRVGFTGALDAYKFDAELMALLAQKNPNMSFVLIGQIALQDKKANLSSLGLDKYKNIYFLGHKPYEILENYYAGFDVYIIPYKLNEYTVGGCFPVKFHDALAAGLPTVVTDLPAYAPFKEVSYVAKTHEEFVSAVKKALIENDRSKELARQKVAEQNDWDGKVEKMLQIISENL
ncbi:MAG TPA: glycosyltransferase, partial [bacterium]|nr:glycosyltransferase [bacterium]